MFICHRYRDFVTDCAGNVTTFDGSSLESAAAAADAEVSVAEAEQAAATAVQRWPGGATRRSEIANICTGRRRQRANTSLSQADELIEAATLTTSLLREFCSHSL